MSFAHQQSKQEKMIQTFLAKKEKEQKEEKEVKSHYYSSVNEILVSFY